MGGEKSENETCRLKKKASNLILGYIIHHNSHQKSHSILVKKRDVCCTHKYQIETVVSSVMMTSKTYLKRFLNVVKRYLFYWYSSTYCRLENSISEDAKSKWNTKAFGCQWWWWWSGFKNTRALVTLCRHTPCDLHRHPSPSMAR